MYMIYHQTSHVQGSQTTAWKVSQRLSRTVLPVWTLFYIHFHGIYLACNSRPRILFPFIYPVTHTYPTQLRHLDTLLHNRGYESLLSAYLMPDFEEFGLLVGKSQLNWHRANKITESMYLSDLWILILAHWASYMQTGMTIYPLPCGAAEETKNWCKLLIYASPVISYRPILSSERCKNGDQI